MITVNKRMFQLALGYGINSFLPIISWAVLGIVIDFELTSTFGLTYPLQFILAIVVDIFGYGVNTFAVKERKECSENYMQSGMAVGMLVLFITFCGLVFYVEEYMYIMGCMEKKFIICCIFSIITFMTSGINSLFSLYYSFKENEKKASSVLVDYNLITYGSLFLSLGITHSVTVSVIASLFSAITITIFTLLKTVKKFKFQIEIIPSIKYVLCNLFSDLGLFVVYFFGIGELAITDYKVMFTFSIWTQISDWVWDVLSSVIPIITRVDSAMDKYDFNKCFKSASNLFCVLFITMGIETLIMSLFFEVNIKYFLIFGILDVIDMIIFLPTCIYRSNLSTLGYTKQTSAIVIIGYLFRIVLGVILPVRIAMYMAQLVGSVVQLIGYWYVNKFYNRKNFLKLKGAE